MKFLYKDINEGVVPEKLKERQSTGINNDDSKPSSKCRPTAQLYRACAVQKPGAGDTFHVAGNRISLALHPGQGPFMGSSLTMTD